MRERWRGRVLHILPGQKFLQFFFPHQQKKIMALKLLYPHDKTILFAMNFASNSTLDNKDHKKHKPDKTRNGVHLGCSCSHLLIFI